MTENGYNAMIGSNRCNWDLSVQIADEIDAIPFKCWDNARRALLTSLLVSEASYIEGWAATTDEPGLIMAHGWLVLRLEEIVDPTIVLYRPKKETMYFPGLRFSKEEVRKLSKTPAALAYGWHGLGHPDYYAAHKAAWEYSNGKPFPEYMEVSINGHLQSFRSQQKQSLD